MTTMAAVDRFLSRKRLALAGASRSGRKFGNTVLKTLTAQGYDIAVVHPQADTIDGHRCYATLTDLPPGIGGLVLVTPPGRTEEILHDAVAAGIEQVWMQQGAGSPAAVEFCRRQGIEEIHGECILMFAEPRGIHRVHRWLWGLFGKLPRGDS